MSDETKTKPDPVPQSPAEDQDPDARLPGTGTDPEDALDRASTDRHIDPSWPEQAQRIIGEKHARSARQGRLRSPDTDNKAGTA